MAISTHFIHLIIDPQELICEVVRERITSLLLQNASRCSLQPGDYQEGFGVLPEGNHFRFAKPAAISFI
jgi:hypothetical protein